MPKPTQTPSPTPQPDVAVELKTHGETTENATSISPDRTRCERTVSFILCFDSVFVIAQFFRRNLSLLVFNHRSDLHPMIYIYI